MRVPSLDRVTAVLAPLVTVLVTFLVIVVTLLVVRPPVPSSAQGVPPDAGVRREVRIGAPGVPSVLDPGAALEGTVPLIARQVFDTLVVWREGSTEIDPALATRWTASRDGLVWSFTLREGVKFHDGTPLTSTEVAASFERQLQPETQSAGRPWRSDGALSTPGLRIGYLAFQTEKEPFSRKPLRHAVAAALDPAVLGVTLDRAAVPLQSFLPPGIWARREGSPILGGSRATARALARESGWPKESKIMLLVPTQTVPLDLPKLAEAIQLLLGSDSMPLSVQPEPEPAVRTLLQAGAYDMALAVATVVGGDPHLLLFPLSTSQGVTEGPPTLHC